jgi:hypothetical protein
VFCHVSSIKDGNMLKEGAEVEFESVYDDRKGKYRADNVTGGCQEEGGGKGGGGGYGGGGYGGGGGGGYDDRRGGGGYDDRRDDRRGGCGVVSLPGLGAALGHLRQ